VKRPPGRSVTLVLCTEDAVLGSLAPFTVPTPYWQSVEEVVAGCRAVYGAKVVVLRLLWVATATPHDGGPVTYLAQVDRRPAGKLVPWTGADPLTDCPGRASYARPGGPQADLAWAESVLDARGLPRDGEPVQVRTWNLSSIWRVPTGRGWAWLKVVPAFFGHEGGLLRRLDPSVAPPVIGVDGCRVLMADVPGQDQYRATGEPLLEMMRMLVGLQQDWAGRLPELAALGVNDRRPPMAVALVAAVLQRHADRLETQVVSRLRDLVDALPERLAEVADCGVPDSLVHGDFHPGNVRGRPGRFTVLDWSDAVVGNPILDLLRFRDWLAEADRPAVQSACSRWWRDAAPGCDPDRTAALLRPVAPLLGAVTYQRFLDLIEPDEHPYHAADPRACLLDADRLAQRPS
jgi:hypothetical protein